MPIKQVFDTREAVPEFLQTMVTEQDGKFIFEAELPHEVGGLRTALQKERDAKTALEKSLKGFEGIDPARARQLAAEAERLEAEKLKSKGDWETREKQLKDQLATELTKRETHFQTEISSRDNKLQAQQAAIEKHLIEAQAIAAIAAAKGVPELLLPHVKRHLKVVEQDGEYQVQVVDAKGNPRIADVKGTPLTIPGLVAEMSADPIYGRAFAAPDLSGSGAKAQPGGLTNSTRTISRTDQDALNNNIEAIAKGEVIVV